MLTIPLEKLAYIIAKAREFDVEVPPVDEDSGSNPSDDAEWDVLEAGVDNPTYQELADAINSLSLIGTPLLADYLEEGLSQLGYSIEDFEIGRM